MCGIAGFWDPGHKLSAELSQQTLAKMIRTIAHRGPDDSGSYVVRELGLALGHQRLSIVDLSPLGHQPMTSASGRYVIVYNGEVYNHRELRQQLIDLGCGFRGHSDTEVILAAFDTWGIRESVPRFNGMFAIAVWDTERKVLTLIRDRLGIKPLYFGYANGIFIFGSELKPFRQVPGFDAAINRSALTMYLRHNYVPTPYSIYDGVCKLTPGCLLEIDAGLLANVHRDYDWSSRQIAFWSAREVIERGLAAPSSESETEVIESLHDRLLRSVEYRMLADVPLGAFLSGGIDSSTVVALMQAQASRPVKTFSIGFREDGFDEAVYAKRVAEHLRTEHTELYVSPTEAMSVIPRLPGMFDEPFADSSQIPTFLVSQLAREHVIVGLSGDGGDELFAGYNRYIWGDRLWNRFGGIPPLLRSGFSRALKAYPSFWSACLRLSLKALPRSWAVANPEQKLSRLAEVMHHRSIQNLYLDLVSHWNDPASVVIGGAELPTAVSDASRRAAVTNEIEAMMATDLVSYLPDDILTKVDRASMSVGLEARVPLLDHNVVEYAWSIPFAMKMRDGNGKWILRQVLQKYVPAEMIDRPKMGFGIPIGSWMRGALRDWTDDLLSADTLKRQNFFEPEPIVRLWQEHRSGRAEHHYALWNILMFQSWLAEQDDRSDLTVGAKSMPLSKAG